jgi:hypothetical protein
MMSDRKAAIFVGAAFLTVMISWSVGFGLIAGILNAPDYLSSVHPNRARIFFGVLCELVDVAAIIGIMVVMFPIMKRFSERMALWYVCFRVIECGLLIIGVLCALALITLSHEYLNGDTPDALFFQTLGTLLIAVRDNWMHLVIPFFYSLAAVVFYWFLYQTKLIPRFISVLGIIASVLVLAGMPMDFFEFEPGAFVGVGMGLSELFLGIWLIAKGFNSTAVEGSAPCE